MSLKTPIYRGARDLQRKLVTMGLDWPNRRLLYFPHSGPIHGSTHDLIYGPNIHTNGPEAYTKSGP